jgi:hypothetical protein
MNLRTLVATVVFVVLVSGVARAAELYTPWLYAQPGEAVQCRIVNTSSVGQSVRIRFYDDHGGLLYDVGPFTVPARQSFGLTVAGGAYCRFTTVNAKTLFRGVISVFDTATGRTSVALPAQ